MATTRARRSKTAKTPKSAAKTGNGARSATPAASGPVREIRVRGAREHNLRGVDVDLPRDRLVVITGLSGSGKSSLAFDTIYAEGERRYVESLSAYARQFLGQAGKPDVDTIEGLGPAISIEQKTSSRNPRSTVGTVTEVYDYLRLLYARIGKPYCYNCGEAIQGQTVQEIVDQVKALPEGTRFGVVAPVVRGRKGEFRKLIEELRKEGFIRVEFDGRLHDLSDPSDTPKLDKKKKHDVDVWIDRLKVKEGIHTRLTDSVELALRKAEGLVKIVIIRPGEENEVQLLSEHFACVDCGISYPEVTPRFFSFNSPHGACQSCGGLGSSRELDPDRILPDRSLSLEQGAIAPWKSSSYWAGILKSLCKHYSRKYKTKYDKALQDMPEAFIDVLLNGSGTEAIQVQFGKGENQFRWKRPFEGVLPSMARRYKETESERSRSDIERFMAQRPCEACKGTRLRVEARNIKVGNPGEDLAVHELTGLSVADARTFFEALELSQRDATIAARLLKEIRARLGFLCNVGLDYLSLDRTAVTLSGGEAQRVRLATQIGSSLVGVLYVLDEPSIGLHQRDNDRLLETLKHLRDIGNTVIVVEHDADTILAADYVVDMGPGAGVHGGEVVVAGTPQEILSFEGSLTGAFLDGRRQIAVPKARRKPSKKQVKVVGAAGNNLQGIDAAFPIGLFTCVTGVSGSGKSTLVNDTLRRALGRALGSVGDAPATHKRLTGATHVDSVVEIDQSPIGRTPRSNPATYTGVFGQIRDLFAGLPESRARGYKAGRYSFNVKGGRCETCQGDGIIRIEMHFLPDVYVTCEVCGGQRYNRETLEVKYKGQSIADVLAMSVTEGHELFRAVPALERKLRTMHDVGLGYLALGQSATTLSGGEAQRLKLARELSKSMRGSTLYVLDEPTTGLHFADVERLLGVLQQLVDAGNTVVVIEHNLDVIKCADWIVDLGPEGGSGGGQLIVEGPPETVAACKASFTGAYLKRELK